MSLFLFLKEHMLLFVFCVLCAFIGVLIDVIIPLQPGPRNMLPDILRGTLIGGGIGVSISFATGLDKIRNARPSVRGIVIGATIGGLICGCCGWGLGSYCVDCDEDYLPGVMLRTTPFGIFLGILFGAVIDMIRSAQQLRDSHPPRLSTDDND
jgi:ABC-type Fe3+-siderophore transport system permease subunit